MQIRCAARLSFAQYRNFASFLTEKTFSKFEIMTNIWIYTDDGAANIDLVVHGVKEALQTLALQDSYTVELVKADDIRNISTSSVKLLIIPGGRATPYIKKLAGNGCYGIDRYIQQGGCYLGFGAGAYFASKSVEFEKGSPLEICRNNQLEFFPGTARGTVYSGFQYNANDGATAATILLEDLLASQLAINSCRLYYNGGCEFIPTPQSNVDMHQVQVLARYKDRGIDFVYK